MIETVAPPLKIERNIDTSIIPIRETEQAAQAAVINKGIEANKTVRETQKAPETEDGQILALMGHYATMPDVPQVAMKTEQQIRDNTLPTGADSKPALSFVVSEIGGERTILSHTKPADGNIPDGAKLYGLQTFSGKNGDFYRFVADNGEVVQLHKNDFMAIYMQTYRTSLMGGLSGAEKEAAEAYLTHLDDPEVALNLDPAKLKEALKSTGRISTESLAKGLETKRQKLPDAPAADAPADQLERYNQIKAYNERIDKAVARLNGHNSATGADMAEVLLFDKPEVVPHLRADIQDMKVEIETLESKLINFRRLGDEENANRIQTELTQLLNLKASTERTLQTYESPAELSKVLGFIESNKISPQYGREINQLLESGDLDKALEKCIEAEIVAGLPEKEKAQRLAQMEAAKKQIRENILKNAGITGGVLLIIMMFIMKAGEGGAGH